ncbi:alpha/beta fold hydrolase [Microbacterium sp. Au-Mic1]|uniref:alpha/beta fold hydrolase n=1 Tax=Microbacterium sp. Au-Mic1 TaxID=2906457 RepID=UPI001E363B1C|nr:alpha/beta fold hydrolase [Microbacterium sp. Au-Mic1]MCE4026257.1 alpha/beta fold hydrolase [Microbacterium sp. Au-Mic1]
MATSELPEFLPGINSVSIRDSAGVEREYLISVPSAPVGSVSIVFHPFGSNPELVLYGEGPGDYLISTLDGIGRSADALGVLVVAPRARGRLVDGVSLAWQSHLDAAWDLATRLRDATSATHITTGGLSMGGLEALVLAGQHPDELAAVWAVNPIVDLAAWHDDIAQHRTSSNLWTMGAHETIEEEVGGTPDRDPHQYRVRSASTYLKELSRTDVRLTWSPADTIIPEQATKHAHKLADGIRAHGGRVEEVIVTHSPRNPLLETGRFAHESCDLWGNIAWAAARGRGIPSKPLRRGGETTSAATGEARQRRRLASVIGLPPENLQEYTRLHADVWPSVLERLNASHITNYSIFSHADLLFAYMEYDGDDFDSDMAAMAADPITQEWWAVCGPLQRPIEDRAAGEWWKTLPEIFHLQ